MTPNSTPEVLYTIVYVTINIVAWAYVLGTITLLVTKQVGGGVFALFGWVWGEWNLVGWLFFCWGKGWVNYFN